MAALPVAKLGALLLKTLAKPVANRIKKSAAEHPKFRTFCISFGRFIQNTITRINIANLGHKTKEVSCGKKGYNDCYTNVMLTLHS